MQKLLEGNDLEDYKLHDELKNRKVREVKERKGNSSIQERGWNEACEYLMRKRGVTRSVNDGGKSIR